MEAKRKKRAQASEQRAKHLHLGHLEGEELKAGDGGEGGLLAKRFGEAHGNDDLIDAELANEEDGMANNHILVDELEDEVSSLGGELLANHSLKVGMGLRSKVKA
ncbi:hypothetical protein COCNU_02G017380 [Cocos nucifera]|uniref:Uncharacterized protein n=1 Tax=Cocos nucifera TaxID=13894 RepID=A0A8K0I0D5_COCNU|nr:hypothetical protein COCNU_02G017380 [Cocos nucifera]